MIKQIAFLALLAILAGQPGYSQQAPREDAPPDPQLAAMPDRVSFVKTYAYRAATPDPNQDPKAKALADYMAQIHPRLAKLEVVKTGDIKQEIHRFTTGLAREVWKSGKSVFIMDSSVPGMIMTGRDDGGDAGNPSVSEGSGDFQEVSWVSAQSFRGEEVRLGVKCFIYKSGDRTAWLSVSGRLPVLFASPQMQVSYSYRPRPDVMMKLPEKLVKEKESVRRAWSGQRQEPKSQKPLHP